MNTFNDINEEATEEITDTSSGTTADEQVPTVYDAIMASMTPQMMANLGVKLIYVNNSELFWVTSTGQLFKFTAHKQALEAEYAWLMSKQG